MSTVKTIENILMYEIENDHLLFIKQGDSLLKLGLDGNDKEKIDEVFVSFYTVGNFIIFQRKNGEELRLYDFNTGKTDSIEGKFFIATLKKGIDNFYISSRTSEGMRSFHVISNDIKVIKQVQAPLPYIVLEPIGKKVVLEENMRSKLTFFDVEKNEQVWEFDLADMGKHFDLDGKEVPGRIDTKIKYFKKNDFIVFGLTSKRNITGPARQYIALNASAGEVKWVYNHPDKIIYEEFYFYND